MRSEKQLSLYLPTEQVKALDALVKGGFYKSRNEAIRIAVRDLINGELWLLFQRKPRSEDTDLGKLAKIYA